MASESVRLSVHRDSGAEPSELILAPKVALGYCDICAGGARGLLGLTSTGDEVAREWTLDWEFSGREALEGEEGRLGASSSGAAIPGPVQVVTFLASDGQPKASVIVLTRGVPEALHISMVAALLDLIDAHTTLDQLLVAAALPLRRTSSPVQIALNDASSGAGWAAWDEESAVQDGVLAAALHLCRARGLRALFLVAPGHRLESCASAGAPAHLAAARTLGAAAGRVLGCACDQARIDATTVQSLWYSDKHQSLPIYM